MIIHKYNGCLFIVNYKNEILYIVFPFFYFKFIHNKITGNTMRDTSDESRCHESSEFGRKRFAHVFWLLSRELRYFLQKSIFTTSLWAWCIYQFDYLLLISFMRKTANVEFYKNKKSSVRQIKRKRCGHYSYSYFYYRLAL